VDRTTLTIVLQHQHSWPLRGPWIFLYHFGSFDVGHDFVGEYSIIGKLVVSVFGYTEIAADHQRLDLRENTPQCSVPRERNCAEAEPG
jgi:hypothetical protein